MRIAFNLTGLVIIAIILFFNLRTGWPIKVTDIPTLNILLAISALLLAIFGIGDQIADKMKIRFIGNIHLRTFMIGFGCLVLYWASVGKDKAAGEESTTNLNILRDTLTSHFDATVSHSTDSIVTVKMGVLYPILQKIYQEDSAKLAATPMPDLPTLQATKIAIEANTDSIITLMISYKSADAPSCCFKIKLACAQSFDEKSFIPSQGGYFILQASSQMSKDEIVWQKITFGKVYPFNYVYFWIKGKYYSTNAKIPRKIDIVYRFSISDQRLSDLGNSALKTMVKRFILANRPDMK